jgi:hypothetical protein
MTFEYSEAVYHKVSVIMVRRMQESPRPVWSQRKVGQSLGQSRANLSDRLGRVANFEVFFAPFLLLHQMHQQPSMHNMSRRTGL